MSHNEIKIVASTERKANKTNVLIVSKMNGSLRLIKGSTINYS